MRLALLEMFKNTGEGCTNDTPGILVSENMPVKIPKNGLHGVFIRNKFMRNLVLDTLKFKKLLELQGKS